MIVLIFDCYIYRIVLKHTMTVLIIRYVIKIYFISLKLKAYGNCYTLIYILSKNRYHYQNSFFMNRLSGTLIFIIWLSYIIYFWKSSLFDISNFLIFHRHSKTYWHIKSWASGFSNFIRCPKIEKSRNL